MVVIELIQTVGISGLIFLTYMSVKLLKEIRDIKIYSKEKYDREGWL